MSGMMEGYIIKDGVRIGSLVKYAWEDQPDANLTQALAVQNTWYPVLATTVDCRIINISFWNSLAAENLEVRVTIDGKVMLAAINGAVDGTPYFLYLYGTSADSYDITVNLPTMYRSFMQEGQSVKVEMRKTSAIGGSTLRCIVKYAILEET
jgi:hypothetical protein